MQPLRLLEVTTVIAARLKSHPWIICFTLLAGPQAWAQTAPPEPYKPTVGQPGKDVVWVPTTESMVEKMLDHAKVTPQDVVMDLGSGDGRMIIAAAKRGAKAIGVEYNADMVEYSRRQAAAIGVAERATFIQGDMYEADVSKATVLALFLLPANLEKLMPKFLDLPPGTRIVANTFWVDGWTADETEVLENGCDNWCTSKLFFVPAKVEGNWKLPDGVLALTQSYQMVEGTFTPESGTAVPVKGRLRGSSITLTMGDAEFEGTVNGTTLQATAKAASKPKALNATKIQ
jgi:precorrin-6B methylase 2